MLSHTRARVMCVYKRDVCIQARGVHIYYIFLNKKYKL